MHVISALIPVKLYELFGALGLSVDPLPKLGKKARRTTFLRQQKPSSGDTGKDNKDQDSNSTAMPP